MQNLNLTLSNPLVWLSILGWVALFVSSFIMRRANKMLDTCNLVLDAAKSRSYESQVEAAVAEAFDTFAEDLVDELNSLPSSQLSTLLSVSSEDNDVLTALRAASDERVRLCVEYEGEDHIPVVYVDD